MTSSSFIIIFFLTAIKHYLNPVFQELLRHNPGGLLILCKRNFFFLPT